MLEYLLLSLDRQVDLFLKRIQIESICYIALTHTAGNSTVVVQNSIVIGSITPNDCEDIVDATTTNTIYADKATPTVSATSSDGDAGGRSGIVFPFISGGDNMLPRHPWTSIGAYPCGE